MSYLKCRQAAACFKLEEFVKLGELMDLAVAKREQRKKYVEGAELAIDKGMYGRARRLFGLAEYSWSDIVTFYDENTANAVYGYDPDK